jgi:carboxypeptidase C (cathepsin A)
MRCILYTPPLLDREGAAMKVRFLRLLFVFVSLLTLAGAPSTIAQAPAEKEPFSEVDGSVTIAGKKVDYKATTGRLPAKDLTGKAKANIFFTAYTRQTDAQPESRPLTFCFNGGPGTSSVFVHLGLFGPRRVLMNDDGLGAPQPVKVIENEFSMLDLTDLVFIDPVSTGFSRADDPKDAKLFHGLEEDTQSIGDFIKAYVSKHSREASPTYIAGESYGTTRAASLSSYVQRNGGVNLSGITLISAVLNFQASRFEVGNDLPYILFLPTYTASAWHHNKLDRALGSDLTTILQEAEQFANGPYTQALHKGNQLSDDERRAMAKQVAKYTGLSEEFVLKSDLRIEAGRFRTELLRETGEVIGRLDSRVKAKVKGGGKGGGDPSNTLVFGLYTEAMKDYMPNVLNYKTDMKYNISGQVNPWNYGKAGTNRFVNVAPRLRAALEKDSKLRVYVANGYCDQATPFAATKYTISHLGPRALTDRITMAYFDAGHMMYAHLPSLRKLRDDMANFVTTVPAAGAAAGRDAQAKSGNASGLQAREINSPR